MFGYIFMYAEKTEIKMVKVRQNEATWYLSDL